MFCLMKLKIILSLKKKVKHFKNNFDKNAKKYLKEIF